jgi:multiple sugar transport system ATP-binding protein
LRLGIEDLLDRKPHQLSGGERQRVALGRAIVRNPAAFLFDEPLSNLDAKLRQQLRVELKRLHRDLEATMIYVTHDQVEAMTLGDRVAVMNEGKILQVGSPLEIYQQPANLFVAKFIGSQPINLCRGTVRKLSDRIRFESGFQIEWKSETPEFERLRGLFRDGRSDLGVVLGFRAEDVCLSENRGTLEVQVVEIDQLGESTIIHARICGAGDCGPGGNGPGEDNLKNSKSIDESVLVRLDPGTSIVPGDRVKLILDSDRLLWFDPDTGENLLKEQK